MAKYWIVVGSAENFQIANKRGFDLFGFKSTRRSESSRMEPGDKLVFYLTGIKKFGGIATVQSEMFEDHKKIFKSEKKPNEDYPFRVKTKPEVILDEDDWLHVPDYVPVLEFTKKGATKNWALHFQGNLHLISEADYKLIAKDMKARARRRSRAMSSGGNGAKTRTGAKAKPSPARKTASRTRR